MTATEKRVYDFHSFYNFRDDAIRNATIHSLFTLIITLALTLRFIDIVETDSLNT